jgi:hypothetical protein
MNTIRCCGYEFVIPDNSNNIKFGGGFHVKTPDGKSYLFVEFFKDDLRYLGRLRLRGDQAIWVDYDPDEMVLLHKIKVYKYRGIGFAGKKEIGIAFKPLGGVLND